MIQVSKRLCAVVVSLASVAGAHAEPVVLQPHEPVKTKLVLAKPVTAESGSVVLTGASTTGEEPSEQTFVAALFPQRTLHTGDHMQSHACIQPSGDAGMGVHIVLERGIVVADIPELPLEDPDPIEVFIRRPYPVTTIRSIGAGAEGGIILVGTTVGIVTTANAGTSVVDVVMMFLEADGDGSKLHAMELGATTQPITMTLDGDEEDYSFLSVSITTNANGDVTIGSPVKLDFTEYPKIENLRTTMNTLRVAQGANFWLPGL